MMYGCLPSEEQDLNEQEELESVKVKPKKGKKLAVKVGAFVLAGSIVGSIVAWDYFNSNVNVDVPLEDIVAEQSEESVLDEKIAENDSFSFDKINELEHYVLISNRLAEMDLNSVCEGMKALTDEEKQEVEAYTILDIEKMLNDIDELNVAEFNDELAKDAILRKLNYAQGIVNSRLQKEGNKVLEKFGKLFIKVCATDACDLGVEQVDSFVFADDAFKNEENTDIGLTYADQVTGKTYDFTIARSCNALRDVVANITALNNFQNEDGVYNKDYNDLVLETINLFKLMLGNDYKADNRKIKAEFNNREVANNLYQLVLKPED